MTHVELDEGQYVAELIYGGGARPRSTAPEPSLLPHLGAYLCHEGTIEDVLRTTWDFAHEGSMSPPWIPLWEATLWGLAGRDDLQAPPASQANLTENYWHVLQALRESRRDDAERMATQRIDIGPQYPPTAGAARLAPLLSRKQLIALLADPLADPATLDAESVRSLLVAAEALSIDLPGNWIDAALNGQWFMLPPESRQAHLLPHLPSKRRTGVADKLATWVTGLYLPPDMRALWVSRIAPFVSPGFVWDGAELLDDLEPTWQEHVEKLLAAPWDTGPWFDVFRAHPESDNFRKVKRQHETTAGAPADIRSRWQAQIAMAAPERGIEIEDTGAFPPLDLPASAPRAGTPPPSDTPAEPAPPADTAAPPTPPLEPRRLQADVLLEDSMQDVMAFVANKTHVIEVSIGRGARIRASAEIDHLLRPAFDKTDKDWLVLPVWFYVSGQKQSGKLRVPRDETKNSRPETFSFVAPADGRVLARIHVMRPDGGKLLQSAILAGDVVGSAAEAESHEPDIELNVDVVAGNLQDPASDEAGTAVIADETTALTEKDGAPVEIDVSELQDFLATLVHEIETAADQQDFNDAAVGKKLATLARAGQQLRLEFDAQLGTLADADPLQIVSLQKGDILPLELIYDGPQLAVNSEVCPTWQQALREGNCDNCAGGGPGTGESPVRVCPMHFWSMKKVIERRTADTRKGRFHVAAERTAGRPRLRPIEAAVVAASGRVDADDVTELRDYAVSTLNLPARKAANWAEWVEVIRDMHPELLVAMPHNQAIDGGINSALMMGEPPDDDADPTQETALLLGSVTPAHVHPGDEKPGPIVLLLGCNTQFQQGKLAGFAGEFRTKGAALTVGTLGELRVDQAPLAAQTLLEQIVTPPRDANSVGDVILSTRRHLLGDGMIIALLLVANGDAEWLLPKQGAPDDEVT
jgi:hypothetical protein